MLGVGVDQVSCHLSACWPVLHSRGPHIPQPGDAMYRLLLLAALLVATPLAGQRLPPVPTYAASSMPSPYASRIDRFRPDSVIAIPRTYWLEGGVVGAVTTGVLGTLWFRGMSDSPPGWGATLGIGTLCAAVGFAPGALIGGQFRKQR